MTRVLLLADMHGQFGKLDSFLSLEPDLVFLAGDITHFGPSESILSVVSRIDVPCLAIPGNCDPRDVLDALDESSAVCLHRNSMTIGNMTILGIGGSNTTPFDTPFELSEEEIDAILRTLTEGMERNVHNILITHAPPEGTLDLIDGKHVGSPAIRRYMKHFDLVCTAHIHEQRGAMEIEGVKIVNPGEGSRGHCAILEFGSEPRDISIQLLTF